MAKMLFCALHSSTQKIWVFVVSPPFHRPLFRGILELDRSARRQMALFFFLLTFLRMLSCSSHQINKQRVDSVIYRIWISLPRRMSYPNRIIDDFGPRVQELVQGGKEQQFLIFDHNKADWTETKSNRSSLSIIVCRRRPDSLIIRMATDAPGRCVLPKFEMLG